MPQLRRWSLSVITLCALIAFGSLGSIAQAQDEKIELRIWDQFTDEREANASESIYAAFTEANPNVTIKRESFQTDQMRETVNTALASGTGPDIIFYDAGPGYAGVLANAGLLAPLDDYATQYGWNDRVSAQSLEATTLDGHLLGMPLQVDLIGMFYNQTILTEKGWAVPETVEDLKTICGLAAADGFTPIAFADNPGWQGFHQFSMTANALMGPEAVRSILNDHVGTWDTPEVTKAIQTYFVDLKEAGCFSEDANAMTYDDGNSLFFTGQSIFHTTGGWLTSDIEANMEGVEIGFVPFPAIDGAPGRNWISGVGSAYFIASASQHQTEAAQLIDFLFSPDIVARWVQEAGFFVPVQTDTTAMDVTPLYRSILEVLQTGIGANATTVFGYNVDVLAPQEFNDAMANGFQAVIAGDKTPEQLTKELQAAWEEGTASP